MASEIYVSDSDALVLYALLYRMVDKKVWNTFTSAFETFAAANWYNAGGNTYAIALTENVVHAASLSRYTHDMPSVPPGAYSVEIYQQVGATPADTDGVWRWKIEEMLWNGSQLVARLPDGWN